MTLRTLRVAFLVSAAAFAAACNSSNSGTEQRVADLEKQLADTQKQLAEGQQKPATTETVEPVAAPSPPAPAAAAAPKPAPTKTAAAKPVSQKPTAPDRSAAEAAETQRLIEQQRAVNAKQAEANAALQRQVDQLKPREVTLPAGTLIAFRTTTELSTEKLANGSTFDGILEHDVKSGDTVVAKARSHVTGVVTSSDPGGRVKGLASLTVGARSIVGTRGNVIAISTDTFTADAESTKKKDAVRTGVATGIGAIIGGIAGGGSGAAKGAGAGAATGVGVSLATRGASAVIPAESLIEFHLAAPVTVLIQPE